MSKEVHREQKTVKGILIENVIHKEKRREYPFIVTVLYNGFPVLKKYRKTITAAIKCTEKTMTDTLKEKYKKKKAIEAKR